LTRDDILWVKDYAAIDSVVKQGRAYFRAVDEAQNELCIASAVLRNKDVRFIRVEYEPPLPGCAKTNRYLKIRWL
jgi:hypothetical protein